MNVNLHICECNKTVTKLTFTWPLINVNVVWTFPTFICKIWTSGIVQWKFRIVAMIEPCRIESNRIELFKNKPNLTKLKPNYTKLKQNDAELLPNYYRTITELHRTITYFNWTPIEFKLNWNYSWLQNKFDLFEIIL